MRDLSKHPSTEQLAIEAFETRERYHGLMTMNSPVDYDERKKAAVELALAAEAAAYAQARLNRRMSGEDLMSKQNTIETDDEARELTKLVCQEAAERLDVSADVLQARGSPTMASRIRATACELRTLAREVEKAERENG